MTDPEKHRKLLMVLDLFSFSWPILNRRYGWFLTISVAIFWMSGYTYWIFNYFFVWPSILINLIAQINVLVLILTALALWINGKRHHNRIPIIFSHLTQVDSELRLQNSKNNFYIWTSFIVWIILLLFTILNLVGNARSNSITDNSIHFSFYVVYFIPVCATYAVYVVYINVVELVRVRFQYILERMYELKTEFNDVKRKNQLILLQSAHLKICHIIDIINTKFSVSLIALMTMLFAHLLVAIYLDAVSFKCLGLQVLHAEILFQFVFILPNVLLVGYIAYICETTANTGRNCGKYIHSIFLQIPETESYVEQFSMQIILSDAKFTAGDFFTLNISLVFSIVGGLFTYFIILIQFTNGDNACSFFQLIS